MKIIHILTTLVLKFTAITHEMGHYIILKMLGIDVNSYIIGNPEGETLSSLGIFKINKYHSHRGGCIQHNGDGYLSHYPFQRITVSYAGPFTDIIMLSLLNIIMTLNCKTVSIGSWILFMFLLWFMSNYTVQAIDNMILKNNNNLIRDGYKIFKANKKVWIILISFNSLIVFINWLYFFRTLFKIISNFLNIY